MTQTPTIGAGRVGGVPFMLPDTGSTDDMASITGPAPIPPKPMTETTPTLPNSADINMEQQASIRATQQVAAYIQPEPVTPPLMQTVVVPDQPSPPVTPTSIQGQNRQTVDVPSIAPAPVPLTPPLQPIQGTPATPEPLANPTQTLPSTPGIVPTLPAQSVVETPLAPALTNSPAVTPSPFPPAPPPPTPLPAAVAPTPQLAQVDVPPVEARAEKQTQFPYQTTSVTLEPKTQPRPVPAAGGGKVVSESPDAPDWLQGVQRLFGVIMGVGILTLGGYFAMTRLDWSSFLAGIMATTSLSEGISPQTIIIPGGLLVIGVVFLTVGFVLQKETAE